jgi:hypothetical protein
MAVHFLDPELIDEFDPVAVGLVFILVFSFSAVASAIRIGI